MATFKNAQDIVNHINSGGKLRMKSATGALKKGDIVNTQAGTAYISGTAAYCNVLVNGIVQAYGFTTAQVEPTTVTKDELASEIKLLETQIETAKSKLKYLSESKQEIFDETEFKVWNTLQLMKGKKSDLEKAKAIAALINS